MSTTLPRLLLAAAMLFGMLTPPVHAEEATKQIVPVGRVKVVLPQPGWESKPVRQEDIGLDGGIAGSIKSSSALFIYRSPDQPADVMAALLVYTTPGTPQSLRTSSDCSSLERYYVLDYTNGGRSFPRCLRVYGQPVPKEVILGRAMPGLKSAVEQTGMEVPALGYPIDLSIVLSSGAVVSVHGMVAPSLVGFPDVKPVSKVPDGMPPGIAAWADALGEAAQNALKLFRDEMPMPKVEFQP